jgi:bZIP transcription factor
MMGSSEDDEARAAKAASLRDLQQQVGGGGGPSSSSPAKRKAAAEADNDTGSDSDDDDKDDLDGKAYASSGGGDSHHRREKRLAMNRESARARRKRKKVLIESLEEQVAGLTEHNRSLGAMVEALVGKVRQLESELALSVLGRPPTLHGQGGGGAGSVAAANAMAAAAAGIGQHARDVGSQEATLLRMLHGPQHSRLMESQMRAGDSLLRRGGPFDFHSLTTGAGDLEAAAAAPWDPYRTQLIGNNPSSMLLPTLQNTVRLIQVLRVRTRTEGFANPNSRCFGSTCAQQLAMPPDMGIGSARLNDAFSSFASGTSSMVPLPDARAPSVAAHAASQQQQQQQQQQQHLRQQQQQAQSASSISELLKRQRQLQRGGGKFPPGYGNHP